MEMKSVYCSINSSVGEANYCSTHVVRNKRFPIAGKPSLQITYFNMPWKQLFKCVAKSINCLDKQSRFNIAPAVQYCSVACERVK